MGSTRSPFAAAAATDIADRKAGPDRSSSSRRPTRVSMRVRIASRSGLDAEQEGDDHQQRDQRLRCCRLGSTRS